MAQSLSSTLRSSGLRTGSVLYNVLSRRWYGLAKRATGEHSWTKNRLAKENERGDELPPSIDELMETPMASLKSCRNAKVTKLNEVYDLCLTPDDIAKAEKFLIAYRHGLSFPRDSLPLVVVRACVRAGLPERALHYVRNKVQFGVFPTRKVYKILMNSLLEKGAAKGVMVAYDLLLSDEWTPDGMTYNIAARANLQLELNRIGLEATNHNSSADTTQNETGGDSDVAKNESEGGVEAVKNESEGDVEAAKNENEGDVEAPKSESDVARGLDLTKTLELCDKCSELEPRLGTKTYRVIVTRLLAEGYTDEASELLRALEADNKLPKQTLFNLKLDLYTSASDFTGALALLDTLRSNRELGMPKEGLPRLRKAITETRNSELLNSLDSMCADLEQ